MEQPQEVNIQEAPEDETEPREVLHRRHHKQKMAISVLLRGNRAVRWLHREQEQCGKRGEDSRRELACLQGNEEEDDYGQTYPVKNKNAEIRRSLELRASVRCDAETSACLEATQRQPPWLPSTAPF